MPGCGPPPACAPSTEGADGATHSGEGALKLAAGHMRLISGVKLKVSFIGRVESIWKSAMTPPAPVAEHGVAKRISRMVKLACAKVMVVWSGATSTSAA